MAGDIVTAIVFALAAAVLGGPEALRLLQDVAGKNPAADVAIIVGAICAVTSAVLGAMLLVRFIRVAGDAPDRATERFARVTLTVAFAAIFLVAGCLLAAPAASVPAADKFASSA
uniref:Uncharacterized protein n=1 Tax=Oryza glumipatula TaxID=40148 RepID=A0A0E0A6D7_9ORYZ